MTKTNENLREESSNRQSTFVSILSLNVASTSVIGPSGDSN